MTSSTGKVPEKMRAALYKGVETIRIVEAPSPAVGPDTVVVQVQTAGICGSDLHSYRGASLRKRFDEWCELGLADGHELAGRVVAKGPAVADLEIGDLVTAEAVWHCGECRLCRAGSYHLCISRQDLAWRGHGAFAEYSYMPRRAVFPLPKGLSSAQGALVEPLAAAYHAVQKSGMRVGSNVLVIGGGTIGQLALAVARVAGARTAAMLARYPHQSKLATRLGATRVEMESPDAIASLRASLTEVGFDAVVDTTGSDSGFKQAIAAARKGATIVLAGGYPNPLTVELGPIVGLELTVVGSLCYGWQGVHRDFEAAADLILTGKVDAEAIVTHTLPFDQVAEAFKLASDKTSGAVKVHLDYTGSAPAKNSPRKD